MSFSDLATMVAYFEEQVGKIDGLLRELDEIQRGFNDQFVVAQDAHESALEDAVQDAAGQYDRLADWMRGPVEQRLPALRAEKEARRAQLEQDLDRLQTERQSIEAQSDAELAKLGEANPRLNAQEEDLKTQEAAAAGRVGEIERQLQAAASGLGWLVNFGRIRGLRHEWDRAAAALYGVRERLAAVRQTWAGARQQGSTEQTDLQTRWRDATRQIGQLRQEYEALTADAEGVCRCAALRELFDGLAAELAPSGDAALDEALKQSVARKQQNADYEGGIAAVSEIMGLLKGVRDGLAHFRDSVEAVRQEQEMHAELARLRFDVPPQLLEFNSIWDALLPTVVDESRAIPHPKEMADIIHQVIADRLSAERIEAMFSLAGETLTEATKQWG